MENKLADAEKTEIVNNNVNNFEEAKPFQEVEPIKKEIRTDSYFDGGLLELIGWKLLSFLITSITLGLGAPWGKCMLYSYQIKHTVYNGKRLKFEGTGGDLFVNMFKWVLLTIITLGIYGLFVPVKKTKWVISNIHFEDEDFIKEESFFDGKTIQLIGLNILCNILNTISLNLLYPFTVCFKLKWINKHTVINRKKLAFNGTAISLFGKYILWCFLTIITFGIYGLWLPIKMLKWQSKHTHIKVVGETEAKDKSLFIAIPIAIICIILLSIFLPTVISKIDSFDIKNANNIFSNVSSKFDFSRSGLSNMPTINPGSNMPSEVAPVKDIYLETPVEETPSKVVPSESIPSTPSVSTNTPVRSNYPTLQEIEGNYGGNLIQKYLVNGEYDESQTIEAGGIISFTINNGKITYNNIEMSYDSLLGYASYVSDSTIAEAYFTYSGEHIRVEMKLTENNYTKETSIDATK